MRIKNKIQNLITVIVITQLLLSSCTNYKNITYFRNISDSAKVFEKGETISTAAYQPLVVQPDDILQITISTLDPQANGALNLSSPSMDIGNVANTISNGAGMNSINGFLVDKNGTIDIPVLGNIKVAGLTTNKIKDLIALKAGKLFKDPVVNVVLANFKVTVLGEVLKPGTYHIEGERANILDALGLAGDMTIYGKRENVMLMRLENGDKKKVVRFDLNDSKMLSSPYFYLRQGDILYVEPSKGKAAATDMSVTKTYAIAASILSVLIIALSRIKF